MKPSNADKYGRSNETVWQFLTEYPLIIFLDEHDKRSEHAAGMLFQTMRELDIPLEYIDNISRTLTGFAKETLVHFKQRNLELHGRIHVFCQKKLIDDANSAKISRYYNAEQTMEPAQIIYPSATNMNGGWGFYVIERSSDSLNAPSQESCRVVELYLYREGE